MEDNAEIAQDIELTPQNWRQQFGEDGLVETPIGTVKMGANQLPKLFEKGRSEQFGMIKPTLENPQIIIEIPSNAIDGGQERGSSLLFVKTFLGKNGQKIYYFKSVTVKKDGLEVSVSNHLDKPKRIREELEKGKLKYRFDGGAQTEHYPANVSVSVSPENVQGKQEENAIWRTPKDTTTFSTEKQGLDYAQPNEVETAANGSELTPQIASSESKDSNNSAEKQEKTEKVEAQRQPLADEQGNPLNADGTLMLDEVLSIDELEDKDFSEPYRNVQLPTLPANVNEAIGADNKPVIIKKSIFEKNRSAHKFTSAESRAILTSALYNTDLTGRTQPSKKPLNWVVIKIDEKSPIAVLEVNNEKNNTEIVGWYTLDERNLERIKRQAYKNGGELIMLSPKDKVESLSTPLVGLSSDNKDSNNSAEKQEKTEKIEQKPAQPSARTANVAPSKPAAPSNKIEDYGEVIKGARKDAMKELAKSVDNATLESLISLPFAKAFKRPDLRKAVDEGALREQDARFAEAVMASYLSTKKPKADTKKDKYRKAVWGKSKVEVWADEAYKGVQLLKQLFEAEPAERDRIMAEALAEHYTGVEAAKAHQERMKEWNPGKTFTGESYPINNVALFNEVLGRLGNDVGTADIPVVGAMPNTSYDSYLLVRPNGDTLFPTHTMRTFEDVVDEVVYLTKLNNADADTEHPGSAFKARGLEPQKEVVGYYVSYFPTIKSTTIRREEFKTKEAADAFYAKISSKKGAMASEPHEMYRISGYGKYEIVFKNPITEEWVETGMTYESEGDALFAIDQERDALNKAVNDKLAQANEKTGKTKATEYIQVRSYFDSGKMKYGVVIADKYGPKKTAFSTMPYFFAEGFATRKEAETALEKNRAEWEGFVKDIIRKRQEYIYFDGKNAPRVGKDYRGGKDVTEKDFAETFGFRGVQFGNWTNQNDRQAAVNNAYDSFMDLANIIGVSPRALSLNGELGIAFGSRGSGRANAHYESNNVVINLTKTRGAGSLAHEWWHALDNYFARQAKVPAGFVTSDKRLAMREQLRQAFDDLIDDVAKSDYNTRSSERGTYWGSPIEETARLFEEWVVDEQTKRGERNHFLAEGIGNAEADYAEMNYLYYKTATEMSNESRKRQGQEPEKVMSFEEFKKTPMALAGFVYPSAEELRTLGEDVRAIFDTVQERVDEETGNVALFHRGDNSTTPPASIEADRWNAIVDMVKESVGADNVITNPEEVKAEYDRIMAGQQRVRERIVEDANSRFNEQLEQQIAGTLPQGHIYQLGTPSPILLSCGLPNLPIELAASRLSDKSMQENHPFDLPEIEGLVYAIQNPLAVFRSATRIGSNVILTELKHGDKSFVVAIQTNRRKGRITVNDIRSIHYRNTDMNIVNWINEGLADYIKPTFAQEWLEPTIKKLRSKPQYNSAEVRAQLKDVAKVVKEFENPKVEAENLRQCIVYHGSGADFEKFDHSHMGEGEGAQAYGWGTYVTEVNGIAKSYAEESGGYSVFYKGLPVSDLWTKYMLKEISMNKYQVIKEVLDVMKQGIGAQEAFDKIKDRYYELSTDTEFIDKLRDYNRRRYNALQRLNPKDFTSESTRNLYTVDIPDDNGQNYLKWEKPLPADFNKDEIKETILQETETETGGELEYEMLERDLTDSLNDAKTGKDLYKAISLYVGDKRASLLLSEMGFVGISYPAQFQSGGRSDGARNYVIFKENDAHIVDHERYFRTPNGEVYGFTIGGRIYLDSSKMNAETPIHEYTELWSKVVAENNPELWRRGKELLTETDTWKEVNADKNYKDLSEDERASETLSRIVAKDAAKKISEISDNKTLVAKLRAWLRQFWKDLKATFSKWSKDDLSKLKVDEFTKIPLRDLVEKVDLSKYTKAKNGQARMAQDRAELNAVNAEREAIVSRAKADGTYMKAPNGKPTNLTERQWADVRTSRFKEWFGDWEKAARVAKLRDSKAVEITGEEYKGKYELNRESAQRYIQANLRGEYQIDDTGEVIRLSNKGAKKVMSHGMSSEAHLKSVAVIPEIIRNGIFIDETTAEKPNSNYDSYRYYVCGLNIGGVDYTVRMTIGVKNGEYYYDHSLTEIEKGNLIEIANGFTPKGDAPIPSYANGKDTRIIPLLQTNSSKVVDENEVFLKESLLNGDFQTGLNTGKPSGDIANVIKDIVSANKTASKVVDENGEPMVVYHGTPSGGFNVFDNSKKQSLSYPVDGYVFASNRKVADGYSISGIYAKGEQMNGTPINPDNENIKIVKDISGRYGAQIDGEWIADSYAETPEQATDKAREVIGKKYYRTPQSEVKPAFVSLYNPLVIESGQWKNMREYIAEAKRNGNDGVLIRNIEDSAIDIRSPRYESNSDVVAFSPNQIKSATDNVGTYDSRENDIRFMFAGEKGAVEADRVEEATTRMDNLAVARKMEADFKERPTRLEKLRNVKPVVITGREIEPSDDRRTYINNAFEYGKSLRGQYVNKDTGKTVELSRSGLKEVLHHDTKDNEQIQSIAAIPQMIENSVYITTIPNTDSRSSADSFDYYVTGLKIGGVDYTAKIVVANIDGKRYYDHKLTDIEKGNLIDLINKAPDSASNSTSSESSAKSGEISSDPIRIPNLNQEQKTIFAESGDVTNPIENPQSDAGKQTTLSGIKDKRLLDILQTSDEENAKRIKLATGWERGADGKWRYEIPDAKIKDTIEIEGKSFKRNEEDMLWTSGKLGNMVDAPDLFETYPQLKDVRLETDEVLNGEGSNGYYDPKRNMIVIHADKLDYLNGILNHEIQHAIQDIEGFAQGGNPDMLQSQNAERVNELQQMRREIEQEVAEGNTDREDELEEIDLELGDYDPEIGGYDYYRHLSGEVEARNVERRMKMTPEERRASLASATEDVARDDQVFLYDNLDVASSKAQTSGNDNDILYRSDDAVKNRIEALFNKAISGEFKGKPISIGRLTDEGKAYLEQVSGETFKDNVDFVLNPSDLIHIYKEHFGNNEKDKGQNIPLGIEDVRNLVDVISSPDKVVFFKEGEGLNRNMFYFFKEAEDGTYNLMEIYSDRKGNLTAKTFYKTKKGSSQRVIDIEKSLLLTSETSLVHPLSDAKIPQMLEFSKSDVADVEDNESQERTQVDALSAKIAALQAKARNRTQNVRELTAEVIRFVKDKANDEVLKNLGEQRFRSMMNGVQAAMMKIASDRITPERQRAEIRRQLDKIDTRITEASVKSNRDAIEKMLNLRVYKFNPMGVLMGNRISENTRRIFDLVQAGITTSSKSWNDRENRYVYYYTLKEGQATTIEDLLQQIDRQMYELPVEDNSVMHKIYAVQILQRYNNAITIHDAIDEINSNLNTAMADRSAAFRAKQAALEAGDADKHAEKLLEWRRLGEEIVGLQGDLLNRTHLYNDALAEFRQGLESLIENGRSAWLDAVQQEAEERLALMRTAFSSIRVPGAIPYKEKEIGKDVAETKENRNNELRTLVSNALPAVATFDSMLRAICINDIGNRYGLYDKIMGGEDGLVFASDKQYKNKQMMFSMVEDKIKELGLGKDINALIARSKKPTDMKIFNKGVPAREKHNGKIMRDGDGNIIFQMIELNVGELMYLYSSSRQEQGRKMLLNAGIDELQIDTIADYIADEFPKEKQFVDWVTDELLPTQRCEWYNGLYEYLYKTQMPDTPHYFPLEVNKKQLYKAEEIGEEVTTLPTSTVGSIIARREHNYGLNLDTNFVDKLIGHINDMEHWYAFAKPIKQINTLLSSTQFRNVVEAQAKGAVSLLKQVANIAVGGNEPNQAGKLPKLLRAISRNDIAANITFRFNTALKQTLSYPAYFAYSASPRYWMYMAKAFNPKNIKANWVWAMNELPTVRERWKSRSAGFDQFNANDIEVEYNRTLRKAVSAGMWANSAVDLLTCTVGARAIYEFEYSNNLKSGMSPKEADTDAKYRAALFLNQTQQSGDGIFLSRMQKTPVFSQLMAYRNANTGYARLEIHAVAEATRMLSGKTRKRLINARKEYYKGQGMSDTAAEHKAKHDYWQNFLRALMVIGVFGGVLPWVWQKGSKGILGHQPNKDDDDKDNGVFFIPGLSDMPIYGPAVYDIYRNSSQAGFGLRNMKFISAPTLETIKNNGILIWDQVINGKEAESEDKEAWFVTLSLATRFGLGFDAKTFENMFHGVKGIMRDKSLDYEYAMEMLNAPRSAVKAVVGPIREGETKDEYMQRLSFANRRIRSNDVLDKKIEKLYFENLNNKLYKEMGISPSEVKTLSERVKEVKKRLHLTGTGYVQEDYWDKYDHMPAAQSALVDSLGNRIYDIYYYDYDLNHAIEPDNTYKSDLKGKYEALKQLNEEYDKYIEQYGN